VTLQFYNPEWNKQRMTKSTRTPSITDNVFNFNRFLHTFTNEFVSKTFKKKIIHMLKTCTMGSLSKLQQNIIALYQIDF
jgi:hypothetical protein